MEIQLSKQAQKSLLQMDANTRNRIITSIQGLSHYPPIGDIKKLKGKNSEHRLRVGDYRVVYVNLAEFVYIIDVDTRGQIYK